MGQGHIYFWPSLDILLINSLKQDSICCACQHGRVHGRERWPARCRAGQQGTDYPPCSEHYPARALHIDYRPRFVLKLPPEFLYLTQHLFDEN